MPKQVTSNLTTYDSRLTTDVFAVVLVGGKGKRLRPLSTDARPKAFLALTKDKKTMFRATVERIEKFVRREKILVVANRRHRELVLKDFPDIEKENLVLEPISRNTAPAIALAAITLSERYDDVIMAIIPTDQYIGEAEKYLSAIKKGFEFLRHRPDAILTLAIRPTYPATRFGYLKLKNAKAVRPGIYKVERFVEKPDLKTAKRFLRSGRYLWNAGAFLFKADTILRALEKFSPKIFNGLRDLKDIEGSYRKLPDISIDYAVMEKSRDIYCVKASYRWQDMGTLEALEEIFRIEGLRDRPKRR